MVVPCRSSCRSDGASEGETRQLCCLLSLAAESTGHGQLVATTQLLRLSQARGHLGPREGFVHGVHGGTPASVGQHVMEVVPSCGAAGSGTRTGHLCGAPCGGSGGHLVLSRTAARTLPGDHHSLEEQLTSP